MPFFSKTTRTIDIISKITPLIGHTDWYISGSFALQDDNYNDIDIFFYTEEAFLAAVDFIERAFTPVNITVYARSYCPPNIDAIQFISHRFGPPEEVLATFDLTCVRKALFPDGTCYIHPTYDPALYFISNFNYGTRNRFHKYYKRGLSIDIPKVVSYLDQSLQNPDFSLAVFYEGRPVGVRFHNELYRFITDTFFYGDKTLYNTLRKEFPEAFI